ncbi:DUF7544 domain-containing protein [Cellulomonas carbonis]|uniref:DUF7847 domain-containing protein n=1 Tax=Cellulomonas carbonis T26 TaxID=947969 RepID=A0A0A0BQW4_9CELL|nr:hypothetical protein N868_02035 [Cellulomonas carbonis T26]
MSGPEHPENPQGERPEGAPAAPQPPAGWGGDASPYGQVGYGQGGYGTGEHGRPGYGQAGDAQPTYGAPTYGAPTYGAPTYGQPTYGQPPQGADAAAGPAVPQAPAPQHGAPQHGAPQYGAPQYGAPPQGYGAPQYGAPQYGAPPQGYGAPQYGAPQYGAPGAPAGYVPVPVQRGIVPLRPLGLAEIFDGAFRSVRANPGVMFGFAALVVLTASVLSGLTQYLVIPSISRSLAGTGAFLDPSGDIGLTDSLASSLATVGAVPWYLVSTAILTGLLTAAVSRAVIGQKVTVGELWSRYGRRVWVLLGFTVVSQVAILLVVGIVVGAVVLLATSDAVGAAIAVGLLGGLVGVVVAVWLSIRLLLVPPALVLEGAGVVDTVKRAWRLTRGSFWRLLGIYLLATVVVGLVTQIVAVPAAVISLLVFPDPTSAGYIFVTTIGTGIAQTITTVFIASVVALLYIDLRIRREGLDVELARAAEAAAEAGAGRTGTR